MSGTRVDPVCLSQHRRTHPLACWLGPSRSVVAPAPESSADCFTIDLAPSPP